MALEENIYEEAADELAESSSAGPKVREQFEPNLPPAFMLKLSSYDVTRLKEELGPKLTEDNEESPEAKNFKTWLESVSEKVKVHKIYGELSRDHRAVPRAPGV